MFKREKNINQIWLRPDTDDGNQHTTAENPFQMDSPTEDYLLGRPFYPGIINQGVKHGRIFGREFEGRSLNNDELELKVLEMAQPQET